MVCKTGAGSPHARLVAAENTPHFIKSTGMEVKAMDGEAVNVIVTLVGSLGFPIAMCIYMTLSLNKTLDRLDERIQALAVRVDTLIDALVEEKRGGKE